MKTLSRVLLLLVGLGLFAWFIRDAGVDAIGGYVRRLGWFAPALLTPYALVYLLDTLGWWVSFGGYAEEKPRYRPLVRVRWIGESINNIIPSGFVGGEAVKVYLLTRRGVPAATGTTSVVASRSCQVLAQMVFIAIGAAVARLHLPADSAGRFAMTTTAVVALGVVALLFGLQAHGIFSALRKAASLLPFSLRILEDNADKLRRIDDQIFNFYRRDRKRFFYCTLTYLAGWMADTLEVYLASHLLGVPIAWSEALAIEAFLGVAKAFGLFIPGAVGVQESGVVLLFATFGLPDAAGMAYAILRRGREVFYTSIGLTLLYLEGLSITALSERARTAAAAEP